MSQSCPSLHWPATCSEQTEHVVRPQSKDVLKNETQTGAGHKVQGTDSEQLCIFLGEESFSLTFILPPHRGMRLPGDYLVHS